METIEIIEEEAATPDHQQNQDQMEVYYAFIRFLKKSSTCIIYNWSIGGGGKKKKIQNPVKAGKNPT